MGWLQRILTRDSDGHDASSNPPTTPDGAPARREGGEPPAPQQVHHSRSLPVALAALLSLESPRALDLVPACPDNMTFFGELGCRLEIFDLYTWLCDYRTRSSRRGDSAIDAALDRLLGSEDGQEGDRAPDEDETVDLILAWDLIDYLETDEIGRLFERLQRRRGDNTRLLMIPSYRGPIPHRPRRYRVVDSEHLRCDEPRSDGRPSPGHKERRLLMSLPGYEIESAFLMQRGVQEFVFRSRGRTADRAVTATTGAEEVPTRISAPGPQIDAGSSQRRVDVDERPAGAAPSGGSGQRLQTGATRGRENARGLRSEVPAPGSGTVSGLRHR